MSEETTALDQLIAAFETDENQMTALERYTTINAGVNDLIDKLNQYREETNEMTPLVGHLSGLIRNFAIFSKYVYYNNGVLTVKSNENGQMLQLASTSGQVKLLDEHGNLVKRFDLVNEMFSTE